ncbi:choice-of-anchor L domain-containing protein [Leifsonia sp. McL0607]|uniref:choice-of-anchor L domain-containing protein n=1 Tax=Leifsonia sp. McL0607 TaxID=3415672 RepID=UPI003CF63450
MSLRALRCVSAVALFVGAGVIVAPVAPAADASPGQAVVDGAALSIDSLVAQLIGEGVTASNVRFAGDPQAIGSFSGMSAIGLGSGVALSTGQVSKGVLGPHGMPASNRLGTPGDADASLLAGSETFDAAVLEFDVVPRAQSLSITYVFGSAEYEQWINPGYNDAFGFFVNGRNCAVIEGEPVRIATINSNVNASLYVDNTSGAVDTAMNGFTVPLSCVAPVVPGVANHVKLVIADTADAELDSTVLLAAGGFVSNSVPSAGNISFSVSGDASAAVTFPGVDADGDALTYAVTGAPAHGSFALSGPGGTYTPAAGYVGQDAFEYVVTDGLATAGPYRVTIDVSKPAASAQPVRDVRYDTVAGEDTALTLVARFADDIEYDPSTVEFDIVRTPTHGTLSGAGAQRTYRAADDYEGSDSFEYTASAIAGSVSVTQLTAGSAGTRTASSATGAAVVTAGSPVPGTRVTSDPVTIRLDVAARPLPQTQPRTVPVFPPSPVKVDPALPQTADERLARTGVDLAPIGGFVVVAILAGVALLTSRTLLRARHSGSRSSR